MPPKRQPSTRTSAKPPASEPEQAAASASVTEQDVKPDPESVQASGGEAEPAQATAGAEPSSSSSLPELPSDPLQERPISISSTPAAASPAPSVTPSAQPPTQRLGSLNRPSIGSGARGGPSARGSRAVAQPKFAGRRSQAARAEAEKAEAERKRGELEARAKEDAAKARREGRGRGRGRGDGRPHRGRGRGGYVGERERGLVASGPFSAGTVSAEAKGLGKKRAPGGLGGGGGGGGGGTTFGTGGGSGGSGGSASHRATMTTSSSSGTVSGVVKREPGVMPTDRDGDVSMVHQPIKTEDGGYISSDEDEAEQGLGKLNVDDLGVIDLTGEDDQQADPLSGFQPVRLKREAHKERTMGLNADGATTQEAVAGDQAGDRGGTVISEKRKGKQRVKDVEITGESEKFQGTYSDSEEAEPAIKPEPTDDDDHDGNRVTTPEPVESNAQHPQEPPSSPESKRKAKERIKTRTLSGSGGAPERPVYQTQEEVDEWERHQQDLRLLYSELGILSLPPPPPPPPAAVDKDGDATMTGAAAPPQQPSATDKKADKVYLFQFPPVLPDLLPVAVKPDPEAAAGASNGGAEAMDVDAPHQPNNAANPVTVSDDPAETSGQPRQPRLPTGAVGKLRIHKSGKATLDWGGTSLSVGMGAEASFLQDVLVAALPEQKVADGEGEGWGRGVAMGMGQVKGKFVVTPDWEEILR